MTDYYKDQLEEAMLYQDFVIDQLRKADPCIIIPVYSSRRSQYEKGESACGIEIKHDKKYENGSPNLYIEIAEKTDSTISEYSPSGIFRNDNTWLYLIGSYESAFLFSKHQLQAIYASQENWKRRGIFAVETPTSKGFCYPVQSAMRNGTILKQFNFKGK